MKTVSTFDAKNKLSALIAAAIDGEPQVITKNGVESAVLISYEEYLRLTAKAEPLVDFFLNSPLRESGLDLTRSKTGPDRDPLEFE